VRVAVVFGGRSTEHAISCVSAGSVLAALDPAVYEVVPVGITPKGAWVITSGDPETLRITGRVLPTVETGTAVVLPGDPTAGGLVVVEPGEGARVLHGVDVVFPVLHGPYGEDGTIQGLLEMAGVPYVGSGVLGSAVAMDKEFTKKLLVAEGLPVGPYAVVRPGHDLPDAERDRLGLPVFVKPARGGSSIGISRVTDWADLAAALAAARAVDAKVLVEAAVPGREIELAVLEGLDGAAPDVSVPAEITLLGGREWYDFEAKYLDDVSALEMPADLPAGVTARLRELAAQAFTALDGAGLARVDFFVGPAGELTVNEVNTMPGFTPISVFPRAWAATGLDYPALLDRLISTALSRPGRPPAA
jgi:D-alanine-D-alanine ligase